MIKNKLNVGDYLFTTSGFLYRITKVNKATYSVKMLNSYSYVEQVPFDGIKADDEFFECDEPQAKALELAIKRHKEAELGMRQRDKSIELIGKAKYFLRYVQNFLEDADIKGVEEIEPDISYE